MTRGYDPLPTRRLHYSHDYATAVQSSKGGWYVWCSCGWLETGWPNSVVARDSLENHLLKAHPDSLEAYTEARS